jgi:hypothetical protein
MGELLVMHAFLAAWLLLTAVLTGLLVAVIAVQRLASLVQRVRAAAARPAVDPAPAEPLSRPELARIA